MFHSRLYWDLLLHAGLSFSTCVWAAPDTVGRRNSRLQELCEERLGLLWTEPQMLRIKGTRGRRCSMLFIRHFLWFLFRTLIRLIKNFNAKTHGRRQASYFGTPLLKIDILLVMYFVNLHVCCYYCNSCIGDHTIFNLSIIINRSFLKMAMNAETTLTIISKTCGT